jgi:hypothetical protein
MGISTSKNTQGSKALSRDILKIEKRGPTEDNLTVIDVPGLFKVTGQDPTMIADRDMVEAMTEDYIKDDRTIVLAVVPSDVDRTTQQVLELAKQHDPDGKRTLGILTKPDHLREKAQQETARQLIENRNPKEPAYLALGYYLVRNRDSDDNGPDRASVQQREEMFKSEPWCSLPKDRVGIAALKARLQ